MKIAITGASGFIGTELLEQLNNKYEIVALTRGVAPALPFNCEWRQTDYSYESLCDVISDADALVHLAAVRGTTSNRNDYVINETITENILKAMAKCGVGRIIFASTISVYDDVNTIPWFEDGKLEARTMYGDSKIACETLIKNYSKEYKFDYSIVRIAQVLGLGEKRRGMMNVFIDTAAAGGEITVIGKSIAKRQYIYVKDLVAIVEKLINLNKGESVIVNAGMPNAYSNYEIARIINKVYSNKTPINYDDSQAETIKSSCMNINKLINVIGYTPMDMTEAITELKRN